MEQADAQIGADDARVVIDERTPLIGVELARQTPPADGFLEAAMKAAGVGLEIISGVGHHSRMIIQDRAQVSRGGLFLSRQMEEGSRREVHHPQFVDQRNFERFGRATQRLVHEVVA